MVLSLFPVDRVYSLAIQQATDTYGVSAEYGFLEPQEPEGYYPPEPLGFCARKPGKYTFPLISLPDIRWKGGYSEDELMDAIIAYLNY